jgi:hypothetical protein
MNEAAAGTLPVFLGIVIYVAAQWLAGMALASRRAGRGLARGAFGGLALLALGLGGSGALAASGALIDFSGFPPPFLLTIAVCFGLTLAIALSPLGARLASQLTLRALVGFQIFRVFVELWLAGGERAGFVPVQMTFRGQNFDVLTGLTAAALALYAGLHPRPDRRVVLAWNVLGLLLLANVVTIAILSLPTPLRAFQDAMVDPFVAHFPFVWLPAFLVQAALLGHLLVFRRLARGA